MAYIGEGNVIIHGHWNNKLHHEKEGSIGTFDVDRRGWMDFCKRQGEGKVDSESVKEGSGQRVGWRESQAVDHESQSMS